MSSMKKISKTLGFLLLFIIVSTSSAGLCKEEKENYFRFIEEHPNVVDSLQGFVPDCKVNGEFMAMQRNENNFFCVSTNSGKIIPSTESGPDSGTFINENICEGYSALWSEFLEWYEEKNTTESTEIELENVTEESCKSGFEYRSCDCPHTCIAGRNMTEVEVICSVCKPICTCPVGSYQYDGECISNQQCMDKEPELTESQMQNFMWKSYLAAYGSELKAKTVVPPEEERHEIPSEPEVNHENWIEEEENEGVSQVEEQDHNNEPELQIYSEENFNNFLQNMINISLSESGDENEESQK